MADLPDDLLLFRNIPTWLGAGVNAQGAKIRARLSWQLALD
jgi:hypothetical protein